MSQPKKHESPVMKSLRSHRSIREYKPDRVPEELLEELLHVGSRAPTAGNLQQYSLLVVDETDKLRALNADAAPMAILALVDAYRLKRWFELSDAPFHHDELINVAIGLTDALLALHNITVAAESLGLGTCYQGSVLSANTRELVGTPAYVIPAGLLLVGYPAEEPELTPRLPLDAVVHRNTYRVPCDEEIEAWYGERYPDWEHSHDEQSRARMQAEGITNWAQRIALGHFSQELLQVESLGLLENLRRGGFKLPTE